MPPSRWCWVCWPNPGWQAMLGELARASGIATPAADQLRQFDRTRKGKPVSNVEWVSPADPEARITRLKDGRTRLAYKPEHAVDLETGAILAAPVHPGDAGNTATLEATLGLASTNLATVDLAPAPEAPAEVVGDKGYHARAVPKRLADGPWTTRIAEPARKAVLRWHGDANARRAVYNNRARCSPGSPGSRSCCARCCASGRLRPFSAVVAWVGPGFRPRCAGMRTVSQQGTWTLLHRR